MKAHVVALALCLGSLGFSETQLVYPWVTNNSQFKSQLIIVNTTSEDALVLLEAQRADGTIESVERTVGAFQQLVESTETLFATLGEGAGYAVTLSSEVDGLQGAMVVAGTGSASGDSPAQANPLPMGQGSMNLLFSFLPIPDDPVAASAPVVVNAGDQLAQVEFFGFQDGERFVSDTIVDLNPGQPFAALTSSLFPDLAGNVFVVASSDQPLLGMAFIFNNQREPSMAPAQAIQEVPGGLDPSGSTYSFSTDVWEGIIQNSCAVSSCHGNGAVSGGMNLDRDNMLQNTVNVVSSQDSSRFRINPGNAEESYLYRKIDPNLSHSGAAMPRNAPSLSSAELEIIRTWINEGAQDN